MSSQCWEPAEPVIAVLDPSKSDPSNVDKWMQFIESTGKMKLLNFIMIIIDSKFTSVN